MSKSWRIVGCCIAMSAMAIGCGNANEASPTSEAKGGVQCHTDDAPPVSDPVTATTDIEALVTKRGKPSVVIPSTVGTELKVTDQIVGSGEEVPAGASVKVHYVGVKQSDCKEFDASWKSGKPLEFGLNQVIKGWTQGLVGMRAGGRRHLVIPSKLAYGDDASSGRPTGTLVFVVDLISFSAGTPSKPTGPTADAAALKAATDRGQPKVTVPSPLPTTLTVTDDVVGTGAELTAASTVLVHYVGVDKTGKEFDSSWSRGEPASFALAGVIPGWSKGMLGMKVGGRRTLVIPGDMAYGDTPKQQGAPAGTLVFVVDLVGAS